MIWLLATYGLFVVGLGIWRAPRGSGDQFLMGKRNASSLLVGAALFTLVGGGELVTLTALAFTYGVSALALFLGYALGFIALAVFVPRLRSHPDAASFLSLPDYFHDRYGPVAGHVSFAVSFLSFLALLVVQFIAAGELLSPLMGFTYAQCLLATAGVTLTYLLVGGFDTVLATDLVQAASRLLLIPLLLAAGLSNSAALSSFAPTEALPVAVAMSLIVTGIFSAASSADVWQRVYAARNAQAARRGLIGGAVALLLFGVLLVGIGLIARNTAVTADPNQAFGAVMTALLPPWAGSVAVMLVLMTVMSTADTEMFLTGGLLSRELARAKGFRAASAVAATSTPFHARMSILLCSAVAAILALLVRDLVTIYTWLISALLVLAPSVVGSLLLSGDRMAGRVSLVLNTIIFIALALSGTISPETAYYVLLPGFAVYAIAFVAARPGRMA